MINGDEPEGTGGGIDSARSFATITLTDCTIADCKAASDGGGIFAASATTLLLTDCTLDKNQANGNGGAISTTELTATNCTIEGNTARLRMAEALPAKIREDDRP